MRTETREVAERFGRAAPSYDDCARVQRDIRRHLCDMVAVRGRRLPAGPLLDAGCGTGEHFAWLAAQHPARRIVGIDLATPMLDRTPSIGRRQADRVCGDIHHLPLAERSLAIIWSSLSLQWCDPQRALAEFGRCLKPGGEAWIATLGPRTFHELRTAFSGIDAADHVLACAPYERWHLAAQAAGFEVCGHARREFHAHAPTPRGLLRDIKAIGAHGVGPYRRRSLFGKRAWQTVADRLEAFRRPDGMVCATYDAIFMLLKRLR